MSASHAHVSERQTFLPKHKFVVLDALRGIAALAVVMHHTCDYMGRCWFPRGYLAVDFFMLLSGFVLALAYQSRLDSGWSTASFLKVRLIRLYPLYFAGLFLGFLSYILPFLDPTHRFSPSHTWLFFALGIFLIPAIPAIPVAAPGAFPLNFASWSLFSEALANVAHALILRRRSQRFLVVLIVLNGLAFLILSILHKDVSFGPGRIGIFLVFPRIFFGYLVGIFLFRHWGSRLPTLKIPSIVPCILLLAPLMIPTIGRYSYLLDFLLIITILPALVLLGACIIPSPATMGTFRLLGTVSYAIYIIHTPLQRSFDAIWWHVTGHVPALSAPWSGLLFILLAFVISTAFERFYDAPLRARLTERFRGPRALPAK